MAEMSVLPKGLDRETSRSGPELLSTRKRQTKNGTLVYHCLIALIGLTFTPICLCSTGLSAITDRLRRGVHA